MGGKVACGRLSGTPPRGKVLPEAIATNHRPIGFTRNTQGFFNLRQTEAGATELIKAKAGLYSVWRWV